MPDYVPAVNYPRPPGYRPEGEENKYNAWYVKTEIKGASSGKLAGKKIALKDNISLAGVPMMNGASTLEGYIPDTDATIVTRMLDAGGTIVGKVHCEYFSALPPSCLHNLQPASWRSAFRAANAGALWQKPVQDLPKARSRHGHRRPSWLLASPSCSLR
jgi:Amidase